MTVLDTLRNHVSVRDYTPEPIPDADWQELLRAAQQASTDATGQMYSAVELRDPAVRHTIGELLGQRQIATAARALVVCLDVRRLRLLLEHRGERLGIRPAVALLFGITDASLFAQSVVVASEAAGYGVCYIGAVQNHAREVANILAIPEGVVPLWGLTIGRPASRTSPKPRIDTRQVVHVDRYRDPTEQDLGSMFEAMKAATRSGDWLNAIRKYFAVGGIMEQREESFRELLAAQGLGI